MFELESGYWRAKGTTLASPELSPEFTGAPGQSGARRICVRSWVLELSACRRDGRGRICRRQYYVTRPRIGLGRTTRFLAPNRDCSSYGVLAQQDMQEQCFM